MKKLRDLFKRPDRIVYHVVINGEVFDFDTFKDALNYVQDYGSKNYISSLSITKVKLYNL